MFLFYKNDYVKINYELKNKILNKFIEFETKYKFIQKIIKRKKMLNYQFILFKIFNLLGCENLNIYLNFPFLSE